MTELSPSWKDWLSTAQSRREAAGLIRKIEPVSHDGAFIVTPSGERLLNLASNDYLGLSRHPAVIEASARAAQRGSGSTSARLMAGSDEAYQRLEAKLAAFQNKGRALIFGSGYLANVGTINALVGHKDVVFSDRLNHASIVDGCLLSRAKVFRYRHCDWEQLESLLAKADSQGVKKKLIVTESVFSMDGDLAPLEHLVALRDRYGAALMVDEAHAIGMFGEEGGGYAAALGLGDSVDVLIGTFGKAFGSYGAYAAADELWVEHLISAARTFIFSTALPPAVIGAIDVSIDLLRDLGAERERVQALATRLRQGLRYMGFDVLESRSQIVPIVIGTISGALGAASALRRAGLWTPAIRPPTVRQDSSRLRLSLTSHLSDDDISRILEAIHEYRDRFGPFA